MTLILRATLNNLLATLLAGALAALVFAQTLSADMEVLNVAGKVFSVWSLAALFIHGFFTERWLRAPLRIEQAIATGLVDSEHFYEDLVAAVQFPIRVLLMSSFLWIGVVVVGLWQLSLMTQLVDAYFSVLVGAILMSVGAWAWMLQLFLNRRLVLPLIERFLARFHGLWKPEDAFLSRALFPLRVKWILLSLFLVVLSSGLSVIYTVGSLRTEALDASRDAMVRRIDALTPILQSEIAVDSSLPPLGVIASEEQYARSLTVSKLNQWLDVPFRLYDPYGQRVYQSQGDLLDNQSLTYLLQSRDLGGGYRLEVLPVTEGDTDRIYPYVGLFAVIVLGTGLAVLLVAMLIGQDIASTMFQIRTIVAEYVQGRYQRSPRVETDDDLGLVALNLSRVRANLADAVGSLHKASDVFLESSEAFGNAVDHVGRSAEEQKRTMSQIAAMLRDIQTASVFQDQELHHLKVRVEKIAAESANSEDSLVGMDRLSSELIGHAEGLTSLVEELSNSLTVQGRMADSWSEIHSRLVRSLQSATDRLDSLRAQVGQASTLYRTQLESVRRSSVVLGDSQVRVRAIEQSVGDINRLVSGVRSGLDELANAFLWVNEIGDDTRLLSMNAAILSGQAQREGRSFSVIARNIAELADSSEHGVNNMQNAVLALQSLSDDLLASCQNTLSGLGQIAWSGTLEASRCQSAEHDLQQMIRHWLDIERLLATSDEVVRAIRNHLDASFRSLQLMQSESTARQYRFTELQGHLKALVGRITEVKGHSQYQAGRAHTIQEHVQAVLRATLALSEIVSAYSEDTRDLIDFSLYIQRTAGGQLQTVQGFQQRVHDFETSSHRLSHDLEQYGELEVAP